MFWDKVAGLYDLFENVYNSKANRAFCSYVAEQIAPEDIVLECACGTGMITEAVAPRCAHITATDYSQGMLKQVRKKCGSLPGITIEPADITHLPYTDASFDKVIAGNVIHLMDDPVAVLRELSRVCKSGGKLIIPTYINKKKNGQTNGASKVLQKGGAGFKEAFDFDSYQAFFRKAGYADAEFYLAQGRMPCAVAVITKR